MWLSAPGQPFRDLCHVRVSVLVDLIRDRLRTVDRRLVIALGAVLVGALLAGGLLRRPAPLPSEDEDWAPAIKARFDRQQLGGESRRSPRTLTQAEVERTEPMRPLTQAPGRPAPSTGAEEVTERDRSAGVGAPVDAGRVFGISRDGIREAIASQLGEVRDCYSAWLEQNPSLAGTMLVSFEIAALDGGGGGVTRLEVLDGGLGQALMEGCVLNALADVRFETPDGPLNVHYPLQFSSDHGDGG